MCPCPFQRHCCRFRETFRLSVTDFCLLFSLSDPRCEYNARRHMATPFNLSRSRRSCRRLGGWGRNSRKQCAQINNTRTGKRRRWKHANNNERERCTKTTLAHGYFVTDALAIGPVPPSRGYRDSNAVPPECLTQDRPSSSSSSSVFASGRHCWGGGETRKERKRITLRSRPVVAGRLSSRHANRLRFRQRSRR